LKGLAVRFAVGSAGSFAGGFGGALLKDLLGSVWGLLRVLLRSFAQALLWGLAGELGCEAFLRGFAGTFAEALLSFTGVLHWSPSLESFTGASWGLLGAPGMLLGVSWDLLGISWGSPGCSWGSPGSLLRAQKDLFLIWVRFAQDVIWRSIWARKNAYGIELGRWHRRKMRGTSTKHRPCRQLLVPPPDRPPPKTITSASCN